MALPADPAHLVPTRQGDARAWVTSAVGRETGRAFLAHGAGGGVHAPDLVAVARGLASIGITAIRVEQPFCVSGKRMETRPQVIDAAFCDVVAALRDRRPVLVGGRSTGARIACRSATKLRARGVLALAFPLLPPPNRSGEVRSRMNELVEAGVPVLVVQGDRDPFGGPDRFDATALPPNVDVVAVSGADHALRATRAHGGIRASLAHVVAVSTAFAAACLAPGAEGTGRRT